MSNLSLLVVSLLVSSHVTCSPTGTQPELRMCDCASRTETHPCVLPDCAHGLTKGVCDCCEVCLGGAGDKCQVLDDNIAAQGSCLAGLRCINEHIRDWLNPQIGYTVNGVCKPDYEDEIEFFKQNNGWIDYRTISKSAFLKKIKDPSYKETYEQYRTEFTSRPIPTK